MVLHSLAISHTGAPAAPEAMPDVRAKKPHYDYRIDFFRGLSLIFIFINHIPGNFFTYFTSRTFSLFNSAEVFMFLAGYSAALGYYSLVPQGLQAFSRKALARARAILMYHIVLVALIMTAVFALVSQASRRTTRFFSINSKASRFRPSPVFPPSLFRRRFSTSFQCISWSCCSHRS